MFPKQVIRQRDFSGGQAVAHAKRRDDEAVVRASARQASNVRVLATGAAKQRPGRSIRFSHVGRVDQVRMSASAEYSLCFGDGTLTIRNSSDVVVARAWGYDWATATVKSIVWDVFENDVVMCFPGQIPKVAHWDGGTEWTFSDFAFEVNGNQKRVPFYRIAPKGITLLPSSTTGSITITFDDDYLVSGMIGNRIRYHERQMTITAVTSARVGTATVNETLPSNRQTVNTAAFQTTPIVGDIVQGWSAGQSSALTGAEALVISVGATSFVGELLNSTRFGAAELVKRSGTDICTITTVADTALSASVVWDEEVMNAYRGWPQSVSIDQNRLIFCDFPGVPSGISWSVIGLITDHHVGADSDDAFFELAPKKSRVYHVKDGADEFVFTDLGIYYIPISESNPLRPGSVSFRHVPGGGSSSVEPVSTAQGLVYVGTGLDRVLAIIGTGQAAQPYIIRPVSDLHGDLFSGVICLEVEEGSGSPPDDRVYAVNADGTVAVGRYQPGKEWVGWVPWDGTGTVTWIGSLGSDLIFSTTYTFGSFAEAVDADQYLDAAVAINDIPTALSAGAQAAIFIPADQGTIIGNMTAGGGVAAAFDGTTAQAAAASASLAASTTAYVGKTLGQKFRIAKAEVYPSNNLGFSDQANVTVSMRAKTGAAPVDYNTEGTELATTGSIADTTSMQTLTSSDVASEWDHVWIRMVIALGITYIAEVKFYSPGETNGTGDLWFYEDATVKLMDGRKYFGSRLVDVGAIVTQAGDDFSAATVIAGQGWTYTLEPFLPHVQGGQYVGQLINGRQLGKIAVAVQDSTGFRIQKWNPNESEWDNLNDIFPAYRMNESQDVAPTAREEANSVNGNGTEYDPRIRIVKDYPGPLTVLEISTEIGA